MAENDSVRQRIVSSVFSKLNAAGHQESYASHVKIWEDVPPDEGGKKARYIILARSSNGKGFIHKSKLNSNGSFSVGKTWKLEELRGIEVINPLAFNITLARTYRWQTENEQDQANFVIALVRLFRSLNGGAPLQVVGFRDPDAPGTLPFFGLAYTANTFLCDEAVRQPAKQPAYARMERAPTPPAGIPLIPTTPRRQHANGQPETMANRLHAFEEHHLR
ncbi:hypothetical protein NM688_g8587 [Phlebia brevispora]|uniref:Uncharacterized protein n=1 Tax=Phlebia brevispora TaxID=194682 RepID=A0ACC1RSN2_9APHY|nr:hypothetical protein NM688_g8587 [Phlebia brevispora]